MNHWLYIEDRETKETHLFELNDIQETLRQNRTSRDIILKARKEGISTYISADYFHEVCFIENTKAAILAHESTSTENIFKTVRMFYDLLPPQLKPAEKFNSKRELDFIKSPYGQRLNTNYSVFTAGAKSAGRGIDVDRLHLSEFGSFVNSEEIFTGIGEALRPGGIVSIESTAKGMNDFYDEYFDAKNEVSNYKAHFFSWFDDTNYKKEIPKGYDFQPSVKLKKMKQHHKLDDEQIFWYHNKTKENRKIGKLMSQEYPATDQEAFMVSGDCVFDTEKLKDLYAECDNIKPRHNWLNRCLKIYDVPRKGKKYIMGVDSSSGEAADFMSFVIIDKETWEVVASYKGKMGIISFCKIIYRFAVIYNNCKLTPERNYLGFAIIDYVRKEKKYPYVYKYKDPFEKTGKKWIYGFNTTAKSRPLLITGMEEALDDNLVTFNDKRIISEMMTFVKHDNGKIEHQTGCHDDLLFGLMIAIYDAKRSITLSVA